MEERPDISTLQQTDSSTSSEDLYDYDTDEFSNMGSWTTTNDFIAENDFDMIDILSSTLEQVTTQIHEVNYKIQAMSSEWTNKTMDRLRKQNNRLEARKDMIQNRLLTQYTTIKKRMNRDAKTVQLRDKVSFVVGVGNACITPVIASRLPDWIPIYYTVQSIYLITLRFFVYKKKQWHYFFFDLCYYVNLLTMLFIWCFPSSTLLFTAAFTLTNGPVLWAIITWRNSLVFHSLDKVTSVFIHIFPPLVTYTLRWLPELHREPNLALIYRSQHFPAVSNMPKMGWWYTLIVSTVFYLAWQIFYYHFVVIGRREKVESGLRSTSYSTLLTTRLDGKKSFIQKMSGIFGEEYKLCMFMFWQFWYNLGTCALTYFFYQSFWFHSSFIVAMFAVSVWNGASYYIDIFPKRYLIEIDHRLNEFGENNNEKSQQQQQKKKHKKITLKKKLLDNKTE